MLGDGITQANNQLMAQRDCVVVSVKVNGQMVDAISVENGNSLLPHFGGHGTYSRRDESR